MRSSKLLVILLAVFSMVFFIACSDDDCDKTDCNENTTLQNVTFTGTSEDGTQYVLKITQTAAGSLRSTYQPKVGDSYVLTIAIETSEGSISFKSSSGTVESVGQNGTLSLKPNSGQATAFTVQTSANGLESITGTITLDNGTAVQASGELEPKGKESGKENGNTGNGADDTPNIPTNHPIIGVWVNNVDGSEYLEFKQDGTGRLWWGGSDEEVITYTINGNLITVYEHDTSSYSIDGNTLTWSDGEWTRDDSASNLIVGIWKQNGTTIEFRTDGTGKYADNYGSIELKYSVSNGKLIFSTVRHSFVYDGGDSFTTKNWGETFERWDSNNQPNQPTTPLPPTPMPKPE